MFKRGIFETIGTVIGVFVILSFLGDIYLYWNVDYERVMFSISGALGWACFLNIRGEYYSFLDMLDGQTKDQKDNINVSKS